MVSIIFTDDKSSKRKTIENLLQQYQGFLKTPSLWKGKNLFHLQQFELPLPSFPLTISHALPPQMVLGKRAEIFFAESIQQNQRYRLMGHNLQVIHLKKTLGEFDFFIEDLIEKKQLHIELVYKFYLYDPSLSKELARWIGPNRKDSLLRKIERLQKHQLPLLYKEESAEILKNLGLNAADLQQQVCFKANLFVPKPMYPNPYPEINPECVVGYWLHADEFSKKDYGNDEFYSPQKKDWPASPEYHHTWFSFTAITKKIDALFQHTKATLIWMKKTNGRYERFFVVKW